MLEKKPAVELNRSLGLWSALSIVIGTVIGSGIFFKQASVLDYTGSTTNALLAWLCGGIITLTAGLTVAEIGSQIPQTGGLYIYMEKIYGKIWGFLAGWMQVIVYGPAMIAALGAYLAILIVDFFGIPAGYSHLIALVAVVSIGALNMLSNRYGASFQIITTICKLFPIAAIIIFGLFFGDANALGQSVSTVSHSTSNFGVGILATLFAYDGWILIANMGDEIKNPKKTLPRAIVLGISLVLFIYVLVSFSIMRVVPADQIHQLGENATPQFAKIAFGEIGGKIMNIGVIISILGCMNGKIMTFPRIMWAMGKNKQLPFHKQLSYLHPKSHSPIVATCVALSIAAIMILFFDADRLSEICIFTVYCFYVMTFIGVFILRRRNKESNLKRVFSVPLYPFTPIVAILGAAFVLVSEVQSDLIGVLISFTIVAIGIPVYLYESHKNKDL
ncbi:APC family permease [Dellaglioa algida]|uniref:APC family permease n=1 Tax=Dellaglioa algida TaxID=105612 RepID=UPI00384EFEDF